MYRTASLIFSVLLFAILLLVVSCAPKRIDLYGASEGIRANVIRTAMTLQGRPYRSGAKGPDSFDCSGFVYYVYRNQGILLPVIAEDQGNAGADIGRNAIQPGDLVLFRIKKDFHIGIMINGNEFIHASTSRGIAVDSVDSPYWHKRLLGFRTVL